MRVHLSYVTGAPLRDYEKTYLPLVREELRRQAGDTFLLEDDPARADVVILWEGFEYKTPEYINLLENEPLLRHHAERVCTINYEDHPEGLLAGLYTSVERPFHLPDIHRLWPFILMNNPVVYQLSRDEVMAGSPRLLFSFAGAASHPIRRELFSLYAAPRPHYHVEHIRKWYNHNDAERRRFVDLALDTTFCLCPHGYCSYTPRITEVMAMARVPVIIADDWIPFSFPENVPYYIRVAERDIAHLTEILTDYRSVAAEYRANARNLWEKYCAPNDRVAAAITAAAELVRSPRGTCTFEQYRERWHSPAFLAQAGWTWRQRVALRAEQHVRRWVPGATIPGVTPLMRYRNAPALQ